MLTPALAATARTLSRAVGSSLTIVMAAARILSRELGFALDGSVMVTSAPTLLARRTSTLC
ncbi:hypothetical protein GCM10027570_41200 [Streptomonospora sediminis]